MSNKIKLNTLLTVFLAIIFILFFDFTKHNPTLSAINPFADDPYDAIGTFGIQSALFLGVFSVVRTIRLACNRQSSDTQKFFLLRAQMATVLAVFVTCMANTVAMIRHLSIWFGSVAGYELVALLGGLILSTLFVGFLIYRSQERSTQVPDNVWKNVYITSFIFLIVLLCYPERIREESTIGALFTVVLGATLLFMQVHALLAVGVPNYINIENKQGKISKKVWGAIILLGILLGFLVVARELTEGGGNLDIVGSAFIISIYIGLEVSGLLIGYGFLEKPLGLFRRVAISK